MQIIEKLADLENMGNSKILTYIAKKAGKLTDEYKCPLCDIGRFIVTNTDDFGYLFGKPLEFVEIIILEYEDEQEYFIHAVHILSDNFGEDIFVPIGGAMIFEQM